MEAGIRACPAVTDRPCADLALLFNGCELDAGFTVGRCLESSTGRELVGQLDQRVNGIHDFGPALRISIVVRIDQRQSTIFRALRAQSLFGDAAQFLHGRIDAAAQTGQYGNGTDQPLGGG